MQDNGQLLIGTDVSYDVRSQTGMLRMGQSYIENGYYSGDEIRKVGNDTYDIDGGSFTTCDLAEPSYWFWARDMRIYRGDKVVENTFWLM
jgi:lipopolysaccharide assembly outer membrane protein LptD (OstA)